MKLSPVLLIQSIFMLSAVSNEASQRVNYYDQLWVMILRVPRSAYLNRCNIIGVLAYSQFKYSDT